MIKDIGWYGLVPVVQKGLGLALLPIYTRYLSPADYGVIALVALIVGIPSVLSDWGVTYSILRDYLDYDGDDAREFLFTLLFFKILVSFLAYGSVFLVDDRLIQLVSPAWEISYRLFLSLSLIAAIMNSISLVASTFLVIERRPQVYSAFQLVVYFITTILQLYMLVVLGKGILAVFYNQLLTAFLSMTMGLVLLWPNLKLKFRTDAIKAVLAYGWQTAPVEMIGYILRKADQWVLQSLLPMSQFGLYSFGARFQQVMEIYGEAVKKGWRPVYLRQLKEKARRSEIIKYGNVMFEISLIVVVGFAFFSKEIIQILADPEYHSAYIVASILVLEVFFKKIVPFIGTNSLVYEKKLYFSIFTVILTAVLNVSLSLYLVPIIGIEGAAISVLLTFMVGAMATSFLATHYTNVGCIVDWFRWLSLIALVIGMITFVFILSLDFWSLFLIKVLLLCLFLGLIAFLERDYVIDFFKNKPFFNA